MPIICPLCAYPPHSPPLSIPTISVGGFAKLSLQRFPGAPFPPVPPIKSGSHSGKVLIVDSTKIIELPGRSGLVTRLEGSSRRQAAHDSLHIYIFFRLSIGCTVEGRF